MGLNRAAASASAAPPLLCIGCDGSTPEPKCNLLPLWRAIAQKMCRTKQCAPSIIVLYTNCGISHYHFLSFHMGHKGQKGQKACFSLPLAYGLPIASGGEKTRREGQFWASGGTSLLQVDHMAHAFKHIHTPCLILSIPKHKWQFP